MYPVNIGSIWVVQTTVMGSSLLSVSLSCSCSISLGQLCMSIDERIGPMCLMPYWKQQQKLVIGKSNRSWGLAKTILLKAGKECSYNVQKNFLGIFFSLTGLMFMFLKGNLNSHVSGLFTVNTPEQWFVKAIWCLGILSKVPFELEITSENMGDVRIDELADWWQMHSLQALGSRLNSFVNCLLWKFTFWVLISSFFKWQLEYINWNLFPHLKFYD